MDNVSPELRAAVANVERAIHSLPPDGASDVSHSANLREAWLELVTRMDIGPAPAMRECPKCKHSVMRAATRCGYCWHKLEMLDNKS